MSASVPARHSSTGRIAGTAARRSLAVRCVHMALHITRQAWLGYIAMRGARWRLRDRDRERPRRPAPRPNPIMSSKAPPCLGRRERAGAKAGAGSKRGLPVRGVASRIHGGRADAIPPPRPDWPASPTPSPFEARCPRESGRVELGDHRTREKGTGCISSFRGDPDSRPELGKEKKTKEEKRKARCLPGKSAKLITPWVSAFFVCGYILDTCGETMDGRSATPTRLQNRHEKPLHPSTRKTAARRAYVRRCGMYVVTAVPLRVAGGRTATVRGRSAHVSSM